MSYIDWKKGTFLNILQAALKRNDTLNQKL